MQTGASIAPLETGVSDLQLSTLAALAAAFSLPTSLRLIGGTEVHTLAALHRSTLPPVELTPAELRQLHRWINSGLLRDRAEAVKWTADRILSSTEGASLAAIVATLFVIVLPEPGLALGAAWGELMSRPSLGPAPELL